MFGGVDECLGRDEVAGQLDGLTESFVVQVEVRRARDVVGASRARVQRGADRGVSEHGQVDAAGKLA
jgi:hypothetical protein